MKIDIIPIGNSKGIRIPKTLLQQCGFEDSAELEVRDRRLVLTPSTTLRLGWGAAFKEMAKQGDDALLDPLTSTEFDEDEWQW